MQILTTSQVTKKIESVRKSGVQFQNAVQASACSIIVHLAKNRDKTLLEKLFAAMPNGSRRKLMIDWMNAYLAEFKATEISITKEGLKIDLAPVDSEEWLAFQDGAELTAEAMSANPWYAYEAPKPSKEALNLDAIIEYLGRKANAKDADADVKAKIAKVKEFAESLNS